jgi:hypothetical protein
MFCSPVIVTGMLILGGAAVVYALSGMDIYAASFLIPLAAAPFTMQGADSHLGFCGLDCE